MPTGQDLSCRHFFVRLNIPSTLHVTSTPPRRPPTPLPLTLRIYFTAQAAWTSQQAARQLGAPNANSMAGFQLTMVVSAAAYTAVSIFVAYAAVVSAFVASQRGRPSTAVAIGEARRRRC